ncbi:MAG: TIGR00341 family protein [Dehalococcoidales bacterium]|jgi:uncharacterized hydrophobic protein (TIGR00341 family)
MELRLVHIYYPENKSNELQNILEQHQNLDQRYQKLNGDWLQMQILMPENEIEKLTDELTQSFADVKGFRVNILNVAATIPRPEPPEKENNAVQPEPGPEPVKKPAPRISREELYSGISSATEISRNFIVLLGLSSIVAALGLQQNNLVIIIGAMVIAPMLGPNIALALATTLGDADLARRALKASGVALAVVLVFSLLLGFVLDVNPNTPEVVSRTQVNIQDIVIALASGSAGALAFTTSLSAALVGVMVSVAILPPLVTFGMLSGRLLWHPALGALLLFAINIVALNLAAVGTFIFQGIRPAKWWEAEKAKKATRIAVVSWLLLLIILAVLIVLSQK